MDVETKDSKAQEKKAGRLTLALATAAGLGYAPIAPGTAGSAGAVLLYLAMVQAPGWAYPVIWLALFALACYVSQVVRDRTSESDPSIVVIDEVVGFIAAMFLLPATAGYVIAAFIVFRALDVIKPFPASYFDKKVDNGFGIVMDDVVAGVYTCLALHLFRVVWG